MAGARSFSRASLSGNPVGRPRTNPPEPDERAKALIAAKNWEAKRGGSIGSGGSQQRSIGSGAEVSAARGEERRGTRFEGEARMNQRYRSSAENTSI